ncbi:hypothetical protein NDU88_008032 [Pleurodeles waltl]|uniref:KRAB domain-containing protein n=1 Tax=Pleurodeles waltl TaxID=8319 RepID=A0AAV7SU56_PLEWA|nr:hypothetical protein NDU88_008032 [Pleurodeles waltl]
MFVSLPRMPFIYRALFTAHARGISVPAADPVCQGLIIMTQVPSRDASCCFSEEEWNLLQEWQKELCGNLMKEIHRALVSLGPLIANTVFSLRTKGTQLIHPLDNNESKRRNSVTCSPSDPNTSHCELLILKREENVQLNSPQETDEREDCLSREEAASPFIDRLAEEIKESSGDPDLGVPLITAVFSLSTRPKEESCVQKTTEPELRISGMSDSRSMLVKESTTCCENKNCIPESVLNQYQILQSDDKHTLSTDDKKALKKIGNRLYHQKYHAVKKHFPYELFAENKKSKFKSDVFNFNEAGSLNVLRS